MRALSPEATHHVADVAEQVAHIARSNLSLARRFATDYPDILLAMTGSRVRVAPPDQFATAMAELTAYDSSQAPSPDIADLLARACLGVRTLNPQMVEAAQRALDQTTDFAGFLPGSLFSSVDEMCQPSQFSEMDGDVVRGFAFSAMAAGLIRVAQPFSELRELRYFAARGLVSDVVASLPSVDPDLSVYVDLVPEAQKAIGYSIGERVIQDRLVVDALGQAQGELGRAVPDARRVGDDSLVLHVMLDRLIPHDKDGRLRSRADVVLDHVRILIAINQIYEDNSLGPAMTDALVDAILSQTSWSYGRDDRFIAEALRPAIEVMKVSGWPLQNIVMMLHFLRGLEPDLGGQRDAAPLGLLQTLCAARTDFGEAFRHLTQVHGARLSYPHWPRWLDDGSGKWTYG